MSTMWCAALVPTWERHRYPSRACLSYDCVNKGGGRTEDVVGVIQLRFNTLTGAAQMCGGGRNGIVTTLGTVHCY